MNPLFDFYTTVIQPDFVQAIGLTLFISLSASLAAVLLGLCSAFLSSITTLRWLSIFYVELFRNTPLLIQLYLYYWGLPTFGITLSPLACGILGLSLYTGTYLSEIFRGSLLAVKQQQTEAALTLGLTRLQTYIFILLPQAFRMMLPSLCNQLIALTKNSSLVAFLTVEEIFFQVYQGAVDEFQPLKFFIIGALLYITITLLIAGITQWIDTLLNNKTLRFPVLISSAERRQLQGETIPR